MSKDIKPKQRLGQKRSLKKRILGWTLTAAAFGGAGYAAYRYTGSTEVDVPVARARRGDFVISVRNRGEIRSTRSVILQAPQVPDPRIVKLAESGKPDQKGRSRGRIRRRAAGAESTRAQHHASAPSIAKSCRPKRRTGSPTRRTA